MASVLFVQIWFSFFGVQSERDERENGIFWFSFCPARTKVKAFFFFLFMTRIEKKKKIISKERIKDRRPFFRVVVGQIPRAAWRQDLRAIGLNPKTIKQQQKLGRFDLSRHTLAAAEAAGGGGGHLIFLFLFTFRVGSAVAYIHGDTWRHTDVVRGRKWATTKQNTKNKKLFVCV